MDARASSPECRLDPRFNHPPWVSRGTQAAVVNLVRRPFDYARFSTLDVQTAYAGMEWRLPFLDQRLVDLLVHLPRRLQNWRGHDRVVLRRVMQGRMPERLRLGPKRASMVALAHRGAREKERGRIESMMSGTRAADLGLIDEHLFRQAYGRYREGKTDLLDFRLTILTEAWLRHEAD
jgi:asparagine synthetase B (glutamine-hydrolysing)